MTCMFSRTLSDHLCNLTDPSLLVLQTALTLWTRSWSWSWVWYGRSSSTTPSPCPCGRERNPRPPRGDPHPNRGSSTGSRARCPTCPSRTSPPTGTTARQLELWLMPAAQVCHWRYCSFRVFGITSKIIKMADSGRYWHHHKIFAIN